MKNRENVMCMKYALSHGRRLSCMTNTKRNVLPRLVVLIVIGLAIWLLYSSTSSYEPQTYHVNSYLDMAIGGDIEKSVGFARDIVLGRYTGHVEEYHGGGNYWGDLYTFQVEEALLGDAQGEIKVLIGHFRKLNETIDDQFIEAKVPLPHYVRPDMSKTYILMLEYLKSNDIYTAAVVPNHIEFDVNDKATLQFNRETTVTELTNKGDKVIFSLENIDLSQFDKITGLTKEELLRDIRKEVEKQAVAE